jgi:MFS family permease
VLVAAAALMLATGASFAAFTSFAALLVIGVLGTINPSAGDVTLFLPTEQALLASEVSGRDRAHLFARYNFAGSTAAAVGALASGGLVATARALAWPEASGERAGFALYALLAFVVGGLYVSLQPHAVRSATGGPLRRSRSIVIRLAALFSLDSLGGGFVVQSLLVLWLGKRFALDVSALGAIFFGVGLLGGLSQFVSARLAARIGYVNTMVFTHLPSNLLLVLAALAPTAPAAIACLLVRALLSQMDVPARQAYVMALVPPEERSAASSVTNVPRSLASATTPMLAGIMLEHSSFGWPLVCAGVLKSIYDIALYFQFRSLTPAESV